MDKVFGNIIFRQLFDLASSTYTYLVGDPQSLEAVIIDTVFEQHFRDRALLEELGLKLLTTAPGRSGTRQHWNCWNRWNRMSPITF